MPTDYTRLVSIDAPALTAPTTGLPPERAGQVYLFDDTHLDLPAGERAPPIELAVNVAAATGRPLLVRGPPGCGKSSLAEYIARVNGVRYYEAVITSRTKAQDLLWTFDAVQRLADAHAGSNHVRPPYAYIEPGPLWWAMNPESTESRGLSEEQRAAADAAWAHRAVGGGRAASVAPSDPWLQRPADKSWAPGVRPKGAPTPPFNAVVLLDELDKADPDVPNNLLVPLGSGRFQVTDLAERPPVEAQSRPLVIITTNEERALPQAFLRRCVAIRLRHFASEGLQQVARLHFGKTSPKVGADELDLYALLANKTVALRKTLKDRPSTAEYLDAVRACMELKVTELTDELVDTLARVALDKPRLGRRG